jgi:hypothetical protein
MALGSESQKDVSNSPPNGLFSVSEQHIDDVVAKL